MIVMDIEATGLLQAMITPLVYQPHIVEFAAVKLDNKSFTPTGQLTFMCKPPIPLPETFVKITGIRSGDVASCKPFATYFPSLCKFFLGEIALIAHNASYDIGVLSCELQRMDKTCAFPWPYMPICSIEATAPYFGRYLELQALYQMVMNQPMSSAHRAMVDTEALVAIVQKLSNRHLFDQLSKRKPVVFQR